jgi:nucleotide-binding universal stress UspA family protein
MAVSDPSVTERTSRPRALPAFANVLCAVDGSRGNRAAIHQAVCLCEPGAKLRFVAVHHEVGSGHSARADLSEMHARAVLDEAAAIARAGEAEPSVSLLRGVESSDLLLAETAGHDLLVAGCHGCSRPGGMTLGSTATQLAQHAEVPLLIARRTVDADSFPQSVLLATDGSDGSSAPTRVAARLAKTRGSALRLVYVPDGRRAERYREVLKQRALIELVTGGSPKIAEDSGHVADRICDEAKGYRASMIAIGRRGQGGVKALGSVSERVLHRAQCSVLVALPQETQSKSRSAA